jgi:hypothetical protein
MGKIAELDKTTTDEAAPQIKSSNFAADAIKALKRAHTSLQSGISTPVSGFDVSEKAKAPSLAKAIGKLISDVGSL